MRLVKVFIFTFTFTFTYASADSCNVGITTNQRLVEVASHHCVRLKLYLVVPCNGIITMPEALQVVSCCHIQWYNHHRPNSVCMPSLTDRTPLQVTDRI